MSELPKTPAQPETPNRTEKVASIGLYLTNPADFLPSLQVMPGKREQIAEIRRMHPFFKTIDNLLRGVMNRSRSSEYRAVAQNPAYSGVRGEAHETHWYDGQALTSDQIEKLCSGLMAGGIIDPKVRDVKRVQSTSDWSLLHGTNPLAHLPGFPGADMIGEDRKWKTVQTLQVSGTSGEWFLGWITFKPFTDASGETRHLQQLHEVSRRPIGSEQVPLSLVRVLAPPNPVVYFALDAEGKQIPLKTVEVSSLDGYSLDPDKVDPVPQR